MATPPLNVEGPGSVVTPPNEKAVETDKPEKAAQISFVSQNEKRLNSPIY